MKSLINYFIFIIFIIIISIPIIYQFNNKNQIENFENLNLNIPLDNSDDSFSHMYTKLYNKVFNYKTMYEQECERILKMINSRFKNKKRIRILDAGTGCGKHLEFILKDKNIKVYSIDKSKNMIQRAKINIPNIDITHGNLNEKSQYQPFFFDAILCLKETIYHNNSKDVDDIMANFYLWLKPGGLLFVHIFDPNKLEPAPREFSQYWYDGDGVKHSITYYDKFSHDAYWKKGKGDIYYYTEEYKKNKSKKKFNNRVKLYIPKKEKITKTIENHYFTLKEILPNGNLAIIDHELYVYEKPKNKIQIYNSNE
jgi:SAM-dependent methyltransferase